MKDLAGREYPSSAILINNDSIQCFGGDFECFGEFKTIDSVKVAVNSEISTDWIKIQATSKIIEIELQTDIEFYRYFPIKIELKRIKNDLMLIADPLRPTVGFMQSGLTE